MWFSGGLGIARLTFGLGDVRGLFQPRWLFDFTSLGWAGQQLSKHRGQPHAQG